MEKEGLKEDEECNRNMKKKEDNSPNGASAAAVRMKGVEDYPVVLVVTEDKYAQFAIPYQFEMTAFQRDAFVDEFARGETEEVIKQRVEAIERWTESVYDKRSEYLKTALKQEVLEERETRYGEDLDHWLLPFSQVTSPNACRFCLAPAAHCLVPRKVAVFFRDMTFS